MLLSLHSPILRGFCAKTEVFVYTGQKCPAILRKEKVGNKDIEQRKREAENWPYRTGRY